MKITTNFKTVVDPATNLEWMCAVKGKYTFEDAVMKFGKADSTGFRLPTIDELETLINVTEKLDLNKGRFWSSSPYVGNARCAWDVDFYFGRVNVIRRDYNGYVRLVRACQ